MNPLRIFYGVFIGSLILLPGTAFLALVTS
jgi:hypothetical protein